MVEVVGCTLDEIEDCNDSGVCCDAKSLNDDVCDGLLDEELGTCNLLCYDSVDNNWAEHEACGFACGGDLHDCDEPDHCCPSSWLGDSVCDEAL